MPFSKSWIPLFINTEDCLGFLGLISGILSVNKIFVSQIRELLKATPHKTTFTILQKKVAIIFCTYLRVILLLTKLS